MKISYDRPTQNRLDNGLITDMMNALIKVFLDFLDQALLDAGVVPGCDITPEAALTKLCYILGKKELSQAQQLELLGRNLRGEIKTTVENSQSLTLKDSKLIRAVVDTLRVNTTKV